MHFHSGVRSLFSGAVILDMTISYMPEWMQMRDFSYVTSNLEYPASQGYGRDAGGSDADIYLSQFHPEGGNRY